jgi:hypothetical protein
MVMATAQANAMFFMVLIPVRIRAPVVLRRLFDGSTIAQPACRPFKSIIKIVGIVIFVYRHETDSADLIQDRRKPRPAYAP